MLAYRNLRRTLHKAITQPRYAYQAFRARFKSYRSYLTGDGYSAPPETISLFLTFRCNLRCHMCGQWGDAGAFKNMPGEQLRSGLSFEEICALVDDVSSFRPTFTLFRGEPTLYKEWLDVVRYIKSKGMRCNMVTNGMRLVKAADEVVDMEMDEIILSLDGEEETHDKSRGLEGAYQKMLEGATAIREAKRARQASRPVITVNCTMNEKNYRNLPDVIHAAGEMGAQVVTFHHLLYLTQETCQLHNRIFEAKFGQPCQDWFGFVHNTAPDMDVETLIQEMEAVKRLKSNVAVAFYPNFTHDEIRRYYSTDEFTPDSYTGRCLSLWIAAYVLPDGNVRAYHSMDYSLGNIRETRFTEIWNNERFRDYRRFVKEHKRFPVCSRGCTELYRYG
ncbi:MAG: radical SAM protein [candidate division Zixibacteria bacterium]|nr:radical SAM protein [candidate division Zixibacteria bacterium]